MMYARGKCVNGVVVEGEPLVDHLINVANTAREIVKKLGRDDLADAAYYAGLLHDVGKALFQNCVGESLTFPHHEIIGAALAYVLYERRVSYYRLVVRPVLLHHQGLRGVDIEKWRIRRELTDREQVLKSLENLINEAEGKSDDLVDVLNEGVRHVGRVVELGERWRSLFIEVDRYETRIVSGALMLADNYVVARATGSAYVEDVKRFVDRLGVIRQ